MKILVTGGAGFIGSNVADAYLAAGHEVTVLDNLSSGKLENVSQGIRLVQMDIRDPELAGFLASERFQVINHHAAQISVPASMEDPVLDAQSNVLGLLNLIENGRANGLERVIFISSGGAVYGELPGHPVDESFEPRPMSPYAVSKRAGELYVDFYGEQYGLHAVVLRYANIYGPRQIPHGEAGVVAIFMDRLLKNQEPIIYRSDEMPRGMKRDYVFVGDVVQANLAALEQGRGIYNIGTGLATDTETLWEAVQAAGGKTLGHTYGPVRAGDIRYSALKCRRAADGLGWRPQFGLARGLAETWNWRIAQ